MFTEILAVASGPHPFWDPARAPVRARHRATTPIATRPTPTETPGRPSTSRSTPRTRTGPWSRSRALADRQRQPPHDTTTGRRESWDSSTPAHQRSATRQRPGCSPTKPRQPSTGHGRYGTTRGLNGWRIDGKPGRVSPGGASRHPGTRSAPAGRSSRAGGAAGLTPERHPAGVHPHPWPRSAYQAGDRLDFPYRRAA
jgi:hypothetical protein